MKKSKIFLGCLPPNTNELELFAYFSQLCLISDMKLKYRSNKQCAGYGTFNCLEASKLDLLTNTPHYHKGRLLECRPYLPKEELRAYHEVFNNRRLYVGNLPDGINDIALFQFFDNISPVDRAYVSVSGDEYGRACGFVVFKDPAALGIVKSRVWFFNGKKIEIKKVSRDKNSHKRSQRDRVTLSRNVSGGQVSANQNSHHDRMRVLEPQEELMDRHWGGEWVGKGQARQELRNGWGKKRPQNFLPLEEDHFPYIIPHMLDQHSTIEAVLTHSESKNWNHSFKNLRFSY